MYFAKKVCLSLLFQNFQTVFQVWPKYIMFCYKQDQLFTVLTNEVYYITVSLLRKSIYLQYIIYSYRNTHKRLTESIAKKKAELRQCFQSELFPLVDDLQNLHGVKILRGNYDLKIARQDYFLGKQSEVCFHFIFFYKS